MVIRRWDLQLLEEDGRHGFVVVLAGVHQYFAHPGRPECPGEGGCLDELRASAEDRCYFHGCGESQLFKILS